MTTKEALINSVIKKRRYESYLEIGTQSGACFSQIKCRIKVGVDPTPINYYDNIHVMDSDAFFDINNSEIDCIFIDGLHESLQVLTDLVNASAILTQDGTIFLHDMLPTSEETQQVPRVSKEWYGDCWKVGYLLLKSGYDLTLKFHKFDCGILEVKLGKHGMDDLLCGYADDIEKLKEVNYNLLFETYKKLT